MTREEEIKREAAWQRSVSEERAFIRGAQWADEHPHWISVEEELPENYREVIIAISHHFCYTAFRCGDKWYLNDDLNTRELPSATHWMPFPAPPKINNQNSNYKWI